MLNFLNTTALWALAAASIPLILHLLSRRRRRVVHFSTVRFLQELQQREMKRLRLRQLLLLIIRTLALVSLVLAFSRPTLRGYLPGVEASTSAVIVLDNSLSMGKSTDESTLFSRAKEIAADVLKTLGDDDSVLLLPMVGGSTKPRTTGDVSRAEADLAGIPGTEGSDDLHEIIKQGMAVLNSSTKPNKELFVISDFRVPPNEPDSIAMMPESVNLYFIPVNSDEANYFVSDLQVVSRLLRVGGDAELRVLISSDSEEVTEKRVDLYLDGVRVGQSAVRIEGSEPAAVEFHVPLKRTGLSLGMAEVEEDALSGDNVRYFHLYVPPLIRVLLIGSEKETIYIRQALEAVMGQGIEREIISVSPDDYERIIVSDFDVVFLTEIPRDAERFAKVLTEFVRRGGGLVLSPGENMDTEAYNDGIAHPLGLSRLGVQHSGGGSGEGYLSLEYVDWQHPLFSGIFISGAQGYRSPKVMRYYDFQNGSGGIDLVRLTDGNSFISEFTVGNGSVLLMASPPLLSWTDFPIRGLWVPFVNRAVEYTATGKAVFVDTLFTGSDLSITVPEERLNDVLVVESPNGRLYSVNARARLGRLEVPFSQTDAAGHYKMKSGESLLGVQSVNVSPEEMGNEPVTDIFAGIYGAEPILLSAGEDIGEIIMKGRYGIELWRYFAAAAFILLILEMAIQRQVHTVPERNDESVMVEA